MFVSGGSQVGDAGDQATLGLKVTNFGPIVEADIELRPLTVFVGPSNTGKSYLAILIYALHTAFGTAWDPFRWIFRHARESGRGTQHAADEISGETVERLFDWIEQIPEPFDPVTESSDVAGSLEDETRHLIRIALTDVDHVGTKIRDRLARSFGVGSDVVQLVRHRSRGGASVELRTSGLSNDGTSPTTQFDFLLKRTGRPHHRLDVSVPAAAMSHLDGTALGRVLSFGSTLRSMRLFQTLAQEEQSQRQLTVRSVLLALSEFAVSHFAGPLSRPAYYLPADRAGVMHAHRAVVGAVIDRAPNAGILDAPEVPTLTGVMADFLRELVQIGHTSEPLSLVGDKLAGELERKILNGVVAVEASDSNYPAFIYRQAGAPSDLPIMNSSSMVSELAPVALYLRHLVEPGETLIIEEPESHLHPAMQAEFTLLLARLVHAGIRIIVTTHSEWVLDQIANLVRMSDLNDDERDGLRGADAVLTREQVGIWLFQPKPQRRGSVVKEIPIDPDVGGLLSGYDDVAEQLYNTWAEIGNRIADRHAT